MASAAPYLTRLAQAIGPTGPARPLGANAWIVEAAGRRLVVKVGPGALDECDGLRQLRDVQGAPPVPDVLVAEDDLLVTTAIDQTARTPAHEVFLGGALARLHSAPLSHWGGGSSWIGHCRVDPARWPDGAGFYGARLNLLSTRCGLEDVVRPVVAKLDELLPPGGPALLHGDLWWGNVLFGVDGRSWLIDPSVHGGHPEEDLAMLALFGPVPEPALAAYMESRPLSSGWKERIELFQLYPLLVHAVLFGGAYRARAEEVARRFA